jgi:hypothetical protein
VAPSRNKEHHLRTLVAEDTTFGESHRILGDGEMPSMSILYLGRYEFKMLVEMARLVSDYRYGTGTFVYSLVACYHYIQPLLAALS